MVADDGVTGPRAALIGRTDRRGRLLWSLPKGHIEEGETPEDAAVREVAEETGIIGEVVAPLGIIDFWFVAEGRRVHKTVHHFLLRAIGGALSDADVEVDRGRLGAADGAGRPAGLRRRARPGRARARPAGRHRVSGCTPPGSTGAHGDGRARPARRPARALAAVGAVALPLVLAAPVVLAVPAAAAPPTPAAAAAPADQPVPIDADRHRAADRDPRRGDHPDRPLTNTGEQTITHLSSGCSAGSVLTSRAELDRRGQGPGPRHHRRRPVQPPAGQAHAGAGGLHRRSPTPCRPPTLQLGQDGVYPALLNANGTVAGGDRGGSGSCPPTWSQPAVRGSGAPPSAWLWPLADRTHRDADRPVHRRRAGPARSPATAGWTAPSRCSSSSPAPRCPAAGPTPPSRSPSPSTPR